MPESGGNDNFWNALLTAGMSAYASGKKKKEDNKQLDWMNSILADKRRYEDEKIARYKSSPAAQMSPMIMEMLVNAYGPKFKKYGIDMPLDKMLSAINGGSQGPSGASGGPSGGGVQQRTLSQIANGEESQSERTVSDMIAAQLGSNAVYGKKNGTMVIGSGKGMDAEWQRPNYGGSQVWGASTGDIGSREETRKSYGSGEWVKGDGQKGFVGTGATGAYLGYTPSVTNTTQWKDNKIENNNLEGDNWEETAPKPEDIMGGNGGIDIEKLGIDWNKGGKRVASGVGTALLGPLGGAGVNGLWWLGNKLGFDGDPTTPHWQWQKKNQGAN
jgi:hypothetical protein